MWANALNVCPRVHLQTPEFARTIAQWYPGRERFRRPLNEWIVLVGSVVCAVF